MGSVGEAAGGRGSCIRSSARQVSRMSTEGEAAPAAETPAEGEPLPEEGSGLPPACMDLTDFLLKVDDFEKMDALDEKAERMDEHKELRTMIEEGKDKLEWYRTVDAAKLEHLKELMLADNYKENLGVLIRTIYDFAFVTYADLPRGAIKNNSMRRLAATTLMEILPPDIAERVNKKMEEDPSSSHDFLSLVGLVSYYGSEPA